VEGVVPVRIANDEVFIVGKSEDPLLVLVQRIHASRPFKDSARLRDFLSYVVDCAIRNLPEAVTEQQIGVNVFGRRDGYNTNEDNIVRSQARRLRLKLTSYFADEGNAEEMVIVIPKGQYLPSYKPALSNAPRRDRASNSFLNGSGTAPQRDPYDLSMNIEAHRIQILEDENLRLKLLVAQLSLEKEAIRARLKDFD
jgi:hypothetical protein